MADQRLDFRGFDISQWLPWTLLFRGLRIARDPKKIALGALGALAMSLGWGAIASVLLSTEAPTPPTLVEGPTDEQRREYQDALAIYDRDRRTLDYANEARRLPWNFGAEWPSGPGRVYQTPLRFDPDRSDESDGWTTAGFAIPTSAGLVLEPIRQLTLPARMTFSKTNAVFAGLLMLLWTIAVWSFFGGAICRISALQLARNGNTGLRESIRFVTTRYLSFFGSPVLPFLGVVLVIALCALGGLIAWVPVLNIFSGALWFLALVGGFVMTLALLGLMLGWPLMYAAIGAEATESFDALSRSFSYVLGRPWNYLFYSIVAILYGAIVMVFVAALAHGVVAMSSYATSLGYFTDDGIARLYYYSPELPGWKADFGAGAEPTGLESIAALLVGFWTHVLFLVVVGFVYSFFWTEVTAIYLLLRRDVDETELEEVYVEEEEEEPFPTATPTVPGPAKVVAAPPSAPTAPGPSLPIVEPPGSA